MRKTVLFHTNYLSLRGTEVALYDYAHYNETLLGNRSVIVTRRSGVHEPPALEKFHSRFPVVQYDVIGDLETIASEWDGSLFYAIKSGENDGVLVKNCRSAVHAVFKAYEPHGDVYAYVSHWLAQAVGHPEVPFVPHMISLPPNDDDLRQELGIPLQARVFGCYGGPDSFDIEFVQDILLSVAQAEPEIYFIFMNIDNFLPDASLRQISWWRRSKPMAFPNIIFLKGTADVHRKVAFINTCDAMLHARSRGETFGIACGEFSSKNKPVITCDSTSVCERSHIEILGERGLYYHDKGSLRRLLFGNWDSGSRKWDAYTKEFSPQPVMEKFSSVFLQN
jgi:hypothetical protein